MIPALSYTSYKHIKTVIMKTLNFLSMTLMLALTVVFTQANETRNSDFGTTKKKTKTERKELRKLEGSTVSDFAKRQFYSDFGNVPDTHWNRELNFDVASYKYDGQEWKAYYDADAHLVGTTSAKKVSDLPLKAQKEISAKYKGFTIGPVIFFDDNEANETDMALFGVQFEDTDNYFVEVTKGDNKTILQVDTTGSVSFFRKL
jgi:hypothetical protein